MSRLVISDCTLVCADGLNAINSLIFDIQQKIEFSDTIINTSIKSLEEYNRFILYEMINKIKTSYIMIVQHDGYPININAWNPKWLDYDYIGAPWINQPWPKRLSVGNGGFSIRSSKLMNRVKSLPYNGEPEDIFICRTNGYLLQGEGYKFATVEDAYSFSVEDSYYKDQFGFHGKNTISLNKSVGIFK